jgi:hypothetical protein
MQHASDDFGPKIVAAVAMSFVLVAAQLFHSVLDSVFMFTGLLGGRATYTWADWAGALGWSALGNMIGGVGLVTSIRLLRVPHRVREERANQLPGTVSWCPGAQTSLKGGEDRDAVAPSSRVAAQSDARLLFHHRDGQQFPINGPIAGQRLLVYLFHLPGHPEGRARVAGRGG